MNKRIQPLQDSILILFFLLLSIIFVYFSAPWLNRLFFIILLFIFYKTDKDYFWIAFFLAINLNPGGFFMDYSKEAPHRLPVYTLAPGISFTNFDFFIIIAFLKAIQKKIKIIYGYKFLIPGFGILFLLIVGISQGIDSQAFINFLRGMTACTLIYSIPVLIIRETSLYKFIYCFFPFVFFELICQLYIVVTGQMVVQQIDPGFNMYLERLPTGAERATGFGYSIVNFSAILSFIFLIQKNKILPTIYVVTVISICVFSVILSATRQQLILIAIIILLNSLYSKVINFRRLIIFITGLIILYFAISHIPGASNAIKGSFDRFQTGFIKDEKTNTFEYRLKKRLPVILNNIRQSPVIGYGVSKKYFEIKDSHLGGILYVLLQGGIIGLMIVIIFVANLFYTNRKYIKQFARANIIWSQYLKILVVGFTGFFIMNLIIDVFYVFPIDGFSITLLYIAIAVIIINNGLGNKNFVYEKEKKVPY